ncbi:DUF3768 domain-containing protein [Paracoccus sediminis]|uniref:DUF3768 domain-containing protein n=1 Tax=Paracoccus sediminis TaxID=1214787 RepID=A0A238YK10_9RHOB|nr:DUF3768 domain-containing protein [Paracoccus sediminis]SNR70963.1 Protein of unknown function [Paracoccus sediminis]
MNGMSHSTYVCGYCGSEQSREFPPCTCPDCGHFGPERDFPSRESLAVAQQSDRLRAALALIAPRLCQERIDLALDEGADLIRAATVTVAPDLRGSIILTPGIAAEGIAFVQEAVVACAVDRNFTESNDPWADHSFGTLDVQGKRIWWKIDLYDADCSGGAENPADPAETHRVVTILFPSEY